MNLMPTARSLSRFIPASILLLTAFFLSALAVLCRPGFVCWDDLAVAQASLLPNYAPGWLGFTYSYLDVFLLRWSGGFSGILFLNTALFLLFLFLVFLSIRRIKSISLQIALSVTVAVMCLLPNHLAVFLTVRRDTTFSYLAAILLLGIAMKRDWLRRDLILISIGLVLLSDIRQEAKVFLVALPLFGFLLGIWTRKQATTLFVSILCVGALFFLFTFKSQRKAFGHLYQMASMSNPLAEIYHRIDVESEHSELHAVIARTMTAADLRRFYSPNTGNVFHQGQMREMKPEYFPEFRSAVYELFWLHPDIWFGNRLHTFLTAIHLEDPVYWMPSSQYLSRWFPKIQPLYQESPQATRIRNRIETALRTPALGIRFFTGSFAFAFLILIGASMSYRTAPRAAFMAWLTLARAAAVFTFAPDPVPPYYFSVLLVAMGLAPIWAYGQTRDSVAIPSDGS
jgi:hypothetical protein